MSHCIVLVKQVPDVSKISDNAFDPETGNLMRNRLPSVINELDAQALSCAVRIRDLTGGGQIVALTMGPPAAADVLKYSLARVADVAVLLTDRALGGADTYATANPLASACRKVVKDLFQGSDDYYIVSGMQSVDGDTAQVPPQVAEELGLPCVAFATDVNPRENGGGLVFSRIVSGGNEVVAPTRLPAVVTVARYDHPLFPTVAATRRAEATRVLTWGAADIQARAVGTRGSKTTVVKVFAPPPTDRKRQVLPDARAFAEALLAAWSAPDRAQALSAGRRYVLPSRRDPFDRSHESTDKAVEAFAPVGRALKDMGVTALADVDEGIKASLASTTGLTPQAIQQALDGFAKVKPTYDGDVWVAAELQGGQLHPATLELIGKARDLADSLERRVGVALLGSGVEALAPRLIEGGADLIHLVDHPSLADFDPGLYRTALVTLVERHWPQILLFAATPQGRTLAPMVSYRTHCGLTADCTGLDIRDNSRKGEIAILAQTRPALGGNVMATICTKDSKCQMATARPGVMKPMKPDASRKGEVIREPVDLAGAQVTVAILGAEPATEHVDLHTPLLVGGGRGMGSREAMDRLVGGLARALGERLSVPVGTGASRAAVESGFADRSHQVGQTGTSVAPKVYVALGISGAIQHMIGVANSGTLFAVNSDPAAPILKQCDYALVGDVQVLVPQILEALGGR